ncbi:hypothetical protein POL68_18245 [Stigmatella sp. ncwal1]|uniref:GLTT repeat-containing protein n=1 Tax=Stigmatella ashevillensis TaxID=2995309 RepID=A0ABT5DBJ3_9BACT|nr:hypothetical protein [Stigmatella ashevillena]MDC0710424.1 hypothetical protein [Stigmatella ashevillena]
MTSKLAGIRQDRRAVRGAVRAFAAGHSLQWLVVLALGCGPLTPEEAEEGLSHQEEALGDRQIRSSNGLSVNGLSVNGLSVNGLSVNGLSVNGLSSASFQSWFTADPIVRDTVMRYVVQCAVPSGQERSFTHPTTGVTYRWQGLLGLAPAWAGGTQATVAEQQVVSACLAAHTNKYGLAVSISVLGKTAQGSAIPTTPEELASHSVKEACFFGNLFTHEGIYAATDRSSLNAAESTSRACGLTSQQGTTECAPIAHVGFCSQFCTLEPSAPFYSQCTYNGVTYRPLTTRILPSDIYRCGDGTCQFTEHCGPGTTYDSCAADCGPCP